MSKKSTTVISPILLSVQMIVDNFKEYKWHFDANTTSDCACFNNFSIYNCQSGFDSSAIYIVSKQHIKKFPVDRYSYITTENVAGKAPHIRNVNKSEVDIINTVLNIFQRYREFQDKLNNSIASKASLYELCELGVEFFKNPVYVHDNMFCILALPLYVKGMREFEFDKETGKSYIPFWLINDFKFDDEYKKTLTKKEPSFWGNEQYPRDARCLYMNIWDGTYYMGRLMIEELQTAIKPGQLPTVEVFAQYVKYIMLRDSLGSSSDRHDYESTFRAILTSNEINQKDIDKFMGIMGWADGDSYLCVKTISQESEIQVKSESSLRSKYAEIFTSFFSFYDNNECCLLVNLTKSGMEGHDIEAALAPLIRESYLYAGISNIFHEIRFVYQAFRQADVALNSINGKDGRWIVSFNQCVLNYIIDSVKTSIPVDMIIAPTLLELIEQDKQRESQNYLTLKTFLENEKDIPKTSEILSIHRTTLLYRLDRISKILKMDLDDLNTRIFLIMCFKLIEDK